MAHNYLFTVGAIIVYAFAVLAAPAITSAGKPAHHDQIFPYTIPLVNPYLDQHETTFHGFQHTDSNNKRTLLRRAVIENSLVDSADIIYSYFGQITIGTSSSPSTAQNFTMLFDTGSYQLWVRSTKCTAALCTGLKSYDGSKSSTYVSTTTPAPKVTYADGTKVSGVYAFDTVGIAGLKVARLPFMEVTETNDPHGTVFDGIMGMCWPPVNAPKTYFLSLVDNGGFNSPAMGYYLNKGATAGAVTMGGVDTARFTGQLTWVPSFGYAADGSGAGPFIFFQGLTIGAAYTNDTGTTNIPWTQLQDNFLAVFDTGTSYGIVPTRVAAALHANIPGITSRKTASGTMWSVACSEANFGTFGDMSLKFVGMEGEIVTLTVEPAVYFVVYSKKGGGYTCESTIVGNDDIQTPVVQNGPVIGAILGNAFLQKFYTVFDWSTNRTGFATAVREQNVTPNLVALNTSTTGTGSNASTNVFRNYWPATPTSDGESTILSNIGGYALKGAPSIANLASTLTSIWMLFA